MAWLVLRIATALTAVLAETERGTAGASAAILVIAAIKIAWIMSAFMELHAAPRAWQVAFGLWLSGVSNIVFAGVLVG